MNKVLKIGIAGYGVVGKRRREYIDQHPQMKTVAVCDVRFGSDFANEPGLQCHAQYRDLLKEDLDALFVCMPNYLAAEVTIEGLRRGLHVFCEKPPGKSLEDIEQVIAVERQHPELKLKYGFNHRYHDSVRDALSLVQTGDLGEIVNIRGVYGKSKVIPFTGGWRAERQYAGGGILLDQGIHMIDLMMLFNGEFSEVKSFVSNAFWNHDVEDNAYAILRDSKGRIGMIHSSATQWQHRFSLDIALTKGYIELKGILSGTKSYGQERLHVGRRNEADTGSCQEEVRTYLQDNSWKDEIDEFAEAVLNNRPIRAGTSTDAYRSMKLVFQIYSADETWTAKFPPLPPKGVRV